MIAAPPGLEPAMDLDRRSLSPQKELVRRFYKDMWDHADVRLIPEIFHSDFTFRGSLGPILVGHSQFADYVRWVTACESSLAFQHRRRRILPPRY